MTTWATIDMRDVVKRSTLAVRITGQRQARARIWAGSLLLRLAAAVIGAQVDVELTASTDET